MKIKDRIPRNDMSERERNLLKALKGSTSMLERLAITFSNTATGSEIKLRLASNRRALAAYKRSQS